MRAVNEQKLFPEGLFQKVLVPGQARVESAFIRDKDLNLKNSVRLVTLETFKKLCLFIA